MESKGWSGGLWLANSIREEIMDTTGDFVPFLIAVIVLLAVI